MFEAHGKPEGDNPTIGLILCSKKNEAIARYSVLRGSKQLFASRYLAYLPTEAVLRRELERERRLIDARAIASVGDQTWLGTGVDRSEGEWILLPHGTCGPIAAARDRGAR